MALSSSALGVVSVLVLTVVAVVASSSVGAVEKPPKPKPALPKGRARSTRHQLQLLPQ